MERRISGVSYMYWMDFYNGILCCGFLCARLISVSLFRLPRRGLPRPKCLSFPATTPRATTPRAITPLPPLHGYHATGVYISRLSRHSLVLRLGYQTRAVTLHHTRKSGYHTRHSSYFEVVRSLPFTGYHATCFSPSTPQGRHTYQPTPHASVDRTSGPRVSGRS